MPLFAGSAIAQGRYVGRIDCWSQWRPTSEEPLWLLLSGATDPPKEIGILKGELEMHRETGMAHFLQV